MKDSLQEHAAKILVGILLTALLVLVGSYFDSKLSDGAQAEVGQHNYDAGAHRIEREIIAKSIVKNRTDLDLLTQQMNTHIQTAADSQLRQERQNIRMEDKLDALLKIASKDQ